MEKFMDKSAVSNFKAKIQELSQDTRKYRQEKESLQLELDHVREEVQNFNAQKKHLLEVFNDKSEQCDEIKERLTRLLVDLREREAAQDNDERRCRQLRQLSSVDHDPSPCENGEPELTRSDRLQMRLDDLRSAGEMKKSDLASLRARLDDVEQRFDDAQERAQNAQSRLRDVSHALAGDQLRLSLAERRTEMMKEADSAGTLESLTATTEAAEKRAREAEEKLLELTKRAEELEEQLEQEKQQSAEILNSVNGLCNDIDSM